MPVSDPRRRNLWITAALGGLAVLGAPAVVAALLVVSFELVAELPPEDKAPALADAIGGSMMAGGGWFVGWVAALGVWLAVTRRR